MMIGTKEMKGISKIERGIKETTEIIGTEMTDTAEMNATIPIGMRRMMIITEMTDQTKGIDTTKTKVIKGEKGPNPEGTTETTDTIGTTKETRGGRTENPTTGSMTIGTTTEGKNMKSQETDPMRKRLTRGRKKIAARGQPW
jgi:hypothetical protein